MSERVALLSPYALSAFGGVQEQVLAMSRVLSARGHEVLVVVPDANDQARYDTPATVLRRGRRAFVPANGSRAPLTLSLRAAHQVRRDLEAFAPDVVHVHEPFAPVLSWSVLSAHQFPTVATFHRSGDGPALRYTRPLTQRLKGGIDLAVAVSEAAATTAREAYGIDCEVLFNGLEVERFAPTTRQRAPNRVLFTVGRLEERKGVATAIEAVREHNERAGEPWRLVVAGDGPERARLEALAAHDEAIEFLGRISDEEKRSWLGRADALIAASTRGESFGVVLLEGMASGALVVASDIKGYRDAAGGHAFLFRPGDASSLERALDEALGHGDEVREAARRYAARWSMSALMDAYEERYERSRQVFAASR